MTSCRRCTALGFITTFTDSEHGRVEICPDCDGKKGFPDPVAERISLGTCKFCNQSITFPIDKPCIMGKSHVIVPAFNAHSWVQ